MILTKYDIYYDPIRDGQYPAVEKPATPVAFVINGEVVYAHGFSPSIGDNIFLANPTYTSRMETVNGAEVEVVTATVGSTSTDMIVDEHFTAVLLSYPLAIEITRTGSILVDIGWKHDERGFYQMNDIDGVAKRIDGMGNVVE
jgi:hypothetical protein